MPDSEGLSRFRARMAGLVSEHASSLDRVEQAWTRTSATADEAAKERSENARKLVERIGERARAAREGEARGVQEITFGHEDEVSREEDPEVESFVRELVDRQRAAAPPEQAAETRSGRQVRAGRFGRADEDEPQASGPAPATTSPEAADRTPDPTPPPKPAPRRRQVVRDDWDDEDFSGRSWLR